MARTPLLRAFQRLAAEHRAAERLGLHATSSGASATRARQFLKRAGVTGAVAVAGPIAAGQRAPAARGRADRHRRCRHRRADAALTLADRASRPRSTRRRRASAGACTRDRSGYWADGQVPSAAASSSTRATRPSAAWRSASTSSVDDLLAAEPPERPTPTTSTAPTTRGDQADADFRPRPQTCSTPTEARRLPRRPGTLTPTPAARSTACSVYDWIKPRVPGGHGSPLGRLLDGVQRSSTAPTRRDQTSLNLVYLLGYQPDERAASRCSASPTSASTSRRQPAASRRRSPTRSATTRSSFGWRAADDRDATRRQRLAAFLTPGQRATVVADHVDPRDAVRRAPQARLRRGAGFDARKKQGDRAAGHGHNGKLQLQFRGATGNARGRGASTAALHRHRLPELVGLRRARRPARAGSWSATPAAVADAPRPLDAVPQRVGTRRSLTTRSASCRSSSRFSRAHGAMERQGDASLPHLDPLLNARTRTGGSASTRPSPATRACRRACLFAGEHTSLDFQGFMEGGAAEGIRAAKEVLAS